MDQNAHNSRAVRGVVSSYLRTAVLMSVLIAILAIGGRAIGGVQGMLAFGAIGCRFLLLWSVERAFNLPPHPYWLIPMRDLFSAAIYLASYLGRDIVWRGVRYRIGRNGELSERRTDP